MLRRAGQPHLAVALEPRADLGEVFGDGDEAGHPAGRARMGVIVCSE
jgi:hypothetical protein